LESLREYLLFDLSKKHAAEIAKLAAKDQKVVHELWDFALSDEEPENWRAAWVIKGIHENNRKLVEPLINDMIMALPKVEKEGVKREFLRMILEYPLPENEEPFGILLDSCFKWLSNPAEPIAIKIHCMSILFEISKVIPEIKQELITTIEVAMQEGSAGIVNRGSKTVKALRLGRLKIS
jgi:hypothetical protein